VADDVAVTAGNTGTWTASADDVGGAKVQRVRSTLEQVRISVVPAIDTAVYTAKDAVGALLTFAGAARYSGGSGRLLAVTVVDKDQERADLDLVLFDRTIGAPTNNAIFDPTDAELDTCIGWVPIGAGMYADFNDNSVAHVDVSLAYVLNGTSMFGVLVARSTPTYTAATDLTVILTCAVD
jgi:hypothetical protein